MTRYGPVHRALRRQLLPYAAGTPCARCGRPIAAGEPVDLDHDDSGVGWLGLAHSRCNRAAGAARGNTARSPKQRIRNMKNPYMGVDISIDRAHTSLVVAGRLQPSIVGFELEYFDGSDTAQVIATRAVERNAQAVVVDPRSPAATLISSLLALGIHVLEVSPKDLAIAHGKFVDEWTAGRLRYAAHPALVASFQFANTRQLAGGEALERRKVDADASPLTASELAVWGLLEGAAPMPKIYA